MYPDNAIGIEGIKLLAEACLRNPTSAHVVGFESLVSLNLANTNVGLRSAIFLSQMLTSGVNPPSCTVGYVHDLVGQANWGSCSH